MAADPIAQAKRRAKAMSRTTEHGYQQALDLVAREEGHPTWKAMLEAHGAARTDNAVSGPKPARPEVRSWRLRELERIEGSRHNGFDEGGIRMLGGPLARLSRRTGVPVWAAAVAIPAMLPILLGVVMEDPFGNVTMAFIVALLSPVLVMATLRSPDHRGARRLRRNTRVLTVFIMALSLAIAIMSSMRFGDRLVDVWIDTARISLFGTSLCLAMWIAAWEGRRRRREDGRMGIAAVAS